MKFKYFLRGLGTGIIFTSLVCLVAYHTTNNNDISDEMVIERAKELGMIESDDPIAKLLEDKTAEKEKKEVSSEKEQVTTEQKLTTEDNASSEESLATTEIIEEATEEAVADSEDSTPEVESQTTEIQSVTITITGGSTSYPVCQKLQELGVITDALDFDNYLVQNGYASRIRVGTHTLTIGMTYEEIAIQISDPR